MMMGLPSRLVSWELDSSQRLQCGNQWRSFWVCGAGAQDVCAIILFECPWSMYLSLSVVLSSNGRRSSGKIGFASHSSVWKRSSASDNFSGEAQTIEEDWKFLNFFGRSILWLPCSGGTTEMTRLNIIEFYQIRLRVFGAYREILSHLTSNIRLPKGNHTERNSLLSSVTELRQSVQGGNGSKHRLTTSTMAEVILVLKSRLQQGITMESYMYVEVLKWCLKQKDLRAAKEVHNYINKSRMEQNVYVANNLLNVYIRYGRLQDACKVFNEVEKKDVVGWNIMIGGYAQHNQGNNVIKVFNKMCHEGVQPDEFTYMGILKTCASPSAMKWGKEVHACIRHSGIESNVCVGTVLLKMCAKSGCINEGRQAFDKLSNLDVISWNVMIGAYADSGCCVEAYELLLQMKQEGFKPDAITFLSILNATASIGSLEWVKEVHSHVLKVGLDSDFRVGSAHVHMYAKSGSIDDVR